MAGLVNELNELLTVKDLKVSFFLQSGEVQAVRGVNFSVQRGEALALVGESGCGKSVTAHAIMGLISPPGRILSGSVMFEGQELLSKSGKEMQRVRGNRISMIFQDPKSFMDPTMRVGNQIAEGLRIHQKLSRRQARNRALELLKLVGIPDPEYSFGQYPHVLSGGMLQRVMIAVALACSPSLLIADEPTTALDVTIQSQILHLLKRLQSQLGTSVVLITHNLGIVAGFCQRMLVMYAGKIVESGSLEDIFYLPQHPYTRDLLRVVVQPDMLSERELAPAKWQQPDPVNLPPGCAYAPRCKYAMQVCLIHDPPDFAVNNGHNAACWLLHPYALDFRVATGLGDGRT